MTKVAIILMGVLVLVPQEAFGIKWLSLSGVGNRNWNQTKYCTSAKDEAGFAKHQTRVCKHYLELMAHVAHASTQVKAVCTDLFKDSRWNCSSLGSAPSLMADLTSGSREQAFVYALSSAALTAAISRACAIGASTKCSCGHLPEEPPPGDFKWGGCSDNLQFGTAFAQMFSEGTKPKSKRSKRTLVNNHNNNAGRLLVAASLSTQCKCHGVSGSCSIKTCWKALPELRQIGADLQKRYSLAVEVENMRIKSRDKSKSRKRRLTAIAGHKTSFDASDLIYYAKSSDYCLPDSSLGSLGTQGRECLRDHSGSAGCRSMCCGRGYTTHVMEIKQRCDCKYYWCCYVKCKTCTKKIEVNRCR